MNIIILNGNPDAGDKTFDRYIASILKELAGRGHQARVFTLREMNIRYCQGCWTCWFKTPGECVHRDDMPAVYRAVMASDLLIFASPVIMGFVSGLLKRANERLIPLIHPYLALSQGECHHRGRYSHYPMLGLILQKGTDTDEDDIRITTDIYRREAINFLSSLRVTFLTERPVKEVCNEIDAL
jgi:multimeric flavodoxin WrbA